MSKFSQVRDRERRNTRLISISYYTLFHDALPKYSMEDLLLIIGVSTLVTALLSVLSCTALAFSSSSTPAPEQDFCYVNDFSNSQVQFHPLNLTNLGDVTEEGFFADLEWGRPFVVRGVTEGWKANKKWDVEYFRHVFSDFELFSSTFATNASPVFESASPQEDVYFGIFLNDAKLAAFLAEDYVYPSFVPPHLKMQGKVQSTYPKEI